MSELYIGNATRHTHMFAYRALERAGVVTQPIQSGGQIRVSPNGVAVDLNPLEIEYIIGQHRTYGLIPIDELDRASMFYGLVYSVGKPLTEDKLLQAMNKYNNKLRKEGQQLRQEAALAVNSQFENRVGPLRAFEMSYTEEEPKGGYSDNLDHSSEGVRVTRQAELLR